MAPTLDSPAFDLPPVAPNVGPFPRPPFLGAWLRHFGGDAVVHVLESDDGLATLVRIADAVGFLGEPDLTDYHTPLGAGGGTLIGEFARSLGAGTRMRLDSLPAEAADDVVEGLGASGIPAEAREHHSTAVLDLPGSEQQWLSGLRKKDRHEIKRKMRRFAEGGATPSLVRMTGPEAVSIFAMLHRLAPGDKGTFMTDDMEAFFSDLHTDAGAVIDVLYEGDEPVSAAFGFEDADSYYLYNSAYDPAAAELSPGVVLVTSLIRAAIRSGRRRFDFLKGDEMYKTRMGAKPRPLYVIEVGGRS